MGMPIVLVISVFDAQVSAEDVRVKKTRQMRVVGMLWNPCQYE